MNENENIERIRARYGCAGDIIFKTAIQYLWEYGSERFKDLRFVTEQMKAVDEKHAKAEADGSHLWISSDFEKMLLSCARDLAQIPTIDMIKYIQRNWQFYDMNDIDYDRSTTLCKSLINWIATETGCVIEDAYEVATNDIGIDDDELDAIGCGYIIPKQEDEQ